MQLLDVAYCNAAINAVLAANSNLLQTSVEDVLKPVPSYGKGDTLDLDARSEILMRESIESFDRNAWFITEEQKSRPAIPWWTWMTDQPSPAIFISDPIDGSSQLKKYFSSFKDKSIKVAEAVGAREVFEKWEKSHGKPAMITGATSSVTCLIGGLPICSVIINCITQHLFVACAAGMRMLALTEQSAIDLDYILKAGKRLYFPAIDTHDVDHMRSFLTFIDTEPYRLNFLQSGLMSEKQMETHLHKVMPVGPSRILSLSQLQSEGERLGFILANGEKIGEWVHWMPYVRYATLEHDSSEPALNMFEIYQERPGTRYGVLMAPPPAYSPFGPIAGSGRFMIDPRRLSLFEDASKVRATLIVAPCHNHEVRRVMEQRGYRRMLFP